MRIGIILVLVVCIGTAYFGSVELDKLWRPGTKQ